MNINEKLQLGFRRLRSFHEAGGSLQYLLLRVLTLNKIPRQLLRPSKSRSQSPTARRINALLACESTRYLEIGLHNGATFEQISASQKHGVEPYPRFNSKILPDNVKIFSTTSDDFFATLEKNQIYNFIFIDGSHEVLQVGRDLINSIRHLAENGLILMDDMVPCDSISAIADMEESRRKRRVAGLPGNSNHGDCYKLLPFIFEHLALMSPQLIMYPDNPQLLLIAPPRLHEVLDLDELLVAFKNYDFSELSYEMIFDSRSLKSYPIWIEEILIAKLQAERSRSDQ